MSKGNYVVKVKHCDNSDKFRQAAIRYEKYGYYTSAPPGTTAFMKYWDEELKRSIHGYETPDGDRITGYFYFYLNYARIIVTEEIEVTDNKGRSRKANRRIESFPRFYDYDRAYFDTMEEAEISGTHLVTIKKRGSGYSYKGASMLCRNFYCIPNSRSIAAASEAEFLTKDGLLSKAWDMMGFVDTNTAWGKKRQKKDTLMHKRASFVFEDDTWGIRSEQGWGSEIMGVTLKNDPNKIRGKRAKLILWEECFTPGTEILMDDSTLKKIEDIKRGDQVLTPSGLSASVSETHSGITDMYRIKQKFGDDYVVSENHKLRLEFTDLSRKKSLPFELLEDNTYTISVKEYLELPKWIKKHSYGIKAKGFEYFDSDRLPLPPYLFGYWLGDGDKSRPAVCTNDLEIIEHFTNHMSSVNSTYQYSIRDIKHSTAKVINFGEYENGKNQVTRVLKERNLLGNKHVPYLYKVSDIDGRLKLLAGFIDADGHLVKSKGGETSYYEIVHKSGVLIDDIRFVANSLGFRTSFRDKEVNGEVYKRLSIIGDIWKIPVKINRKKVFKFKRRTRLHTTPIEIEFVGKGDYYGFTLETLTDLEEERAFLLKDFTVVQNSGKFPNLRLSWGVTRPSVETDSGIAFGLMIAYGTGGTSEADYQGLQDMFYHPKSFNALPIENIWDDGAAGTDCGFFVPQYYNMEGYDVKGIAEEGRYFMDKNGNSDIAFAKKYSLAERDIIIENSSNRVVVDSFVTERPFTPVEATLQLGGNIFPKKDLIAHLAAIRNSTKLSQFKQVGDLVFGENGKLKWDIGPQYNDLTKYHLNPSDDPAGAIVIWEHPPQDEDIPYGLYIIGTDPYDHDQSGTNSLGSAIVYKRVQTFESYYNLPVAEYTGRPETAEEFYEKVRRLALYFNAKILYENEKKGLFSYFSHKHCEHLLATQPDIIKDIVQNSKVQRGYGIHMNTPIKDWGEGLIKDWLIDEELGIGRPNLTKIFSEPLLEELINYNPDGNFDRVVAFMMVMIMLQELHHVNVKKKKKIEKNVLFSNGIFREEERLVI